MRGKPRRDSSKCAVINKTVSFNVLNNYERELLEYIESWTNISGAIKRLIAADMSPVKEPVPVSTPFVEPLSTVAESVSVTSDNWDPVSELF